MKNTEESSNGVAHFGMVYVFAKKVIGSGQASGCSVLVI